jgi:DNA-directed RNA polymerase specialized sigma24 family protein
MDHQEPPQHLSQINTIWSTLVKAHGPDGDERKAALDRLVQRYSRPIYCYLVAVLRDRAAAEEVFQVFALHLVQRDYRHADAAKGRFRQYLKTVLFHLVANYRQRQMRQPPQAGSVLLEAAAESSATDDREFQTTWREDLLARTWEQLAHEEETSGRLLHTMLQYRTQHPEVDSQTMAAELGRQLGRSFTAAGVRQTIHRAREHFADLLLDEVAQSLQTSSPADLEQELADLELLSYCREALQRRYQDN